LKSVVKLRIDVETLRDFLSSNKVTNVSRALAELEVDSTESVRLLLKN
jgi:hypothetical protein